MTDLSNLKILMLAPCLGKFGGIETFCLTLIEDLIYKGASVRLLRKKVAGFQDDESIQKNENEIRSSWTEKEKKRFTSQFVSQRFVNQKYIQESDLHSSPQPNGGGCMACQKKLNRPCVMTIYNWRRTGIHPRLLAWRWAVSQADRRWYISEFVWDSWEKKRRHGSSRLPVVSRMPQGEISPEKKKRIFIYRKVGTEQGDSNFAEAYARLKADPKEYSTMIGYVPYGRKFCVLFRSKEYKVCKCLGLSVNLKDNSTPAKQNGWSPHPILRKTLD